MQRASCPCWWCVWWIKPGPHIQQHNKRQPVTTRQQTAVFLCNNKSSTGFSCHEILFNRWRRFPLSVNVFRLNDKSNWTGQTEQLILWIGTLWLLSRGVARFTIDEWHALFSAHTISRHERLLWAIIINISSSEQTAERSQSRTRRRFHGDKWQEVDYV